jgi:tetratricopeptide (TPR) repeat protein
MEEPRLLAEVELAPPPEPPPPPDYTVEELVHEVKRSAEVRRPPEDPEAHYQLGIAYREMGLPEDALREFEVAIRAGGRLPRYLLAMARCLADRKQLPQAVELLREALHSKGLSSQEAGVLNFELGALYEKIGDKPQARHHYEKVVMHEPGFRDVRARLERLRDKPPAADAADVEELDRAFDDVFSLGDEETGKRR